MKNLKVEAFFSREVLHLLLIVSNLQWMHF